MTSQQQSRQGISPSDETVIKTLATAENPLSTSRVADELGIPRSSAWDILQRLEQEDMVYSWKAHQNTRMWDVEGHFGDTSIRDVYVKSPIDQYLETGEFPDDVAWNTIAEMIQEILVELNWETSLNGGVKYEEIKMLAALFDLSVSEFMQLSPSEVHSLIHDGEVGHIPRESDYELSDGTTVTKYSSEDFRQKRRAEGILQKTVAERVGITQSTLSAWENGDEDTLSDKTIDQLWSVVEGELPQK